LAKVARGKDSEGGEVVELGVLEAAIGCSGWWKLVVGLFCLRGGKTFGRVLLRYISSRLALQDNIDTGRPSYYRQPEYSRQIPRTGAMADVPRYLRNLDITKNKTYAFERQLIHIFFHSSDVHIHFT
jgi:hypothetical protein